MLIKLVMLLKRASVVVIGIAFLETAQCAGITIAPALVALIEKQATFFAINGLMLENAAGLVTEYNTDVLASKAFRSAFDEFDGIGTSGGLKQQQQEQCCDGYDWGILH
jgi:hypothetical protein